MSVDIISGAGSDLLTIDATSKAARVSPYGADGAYSGKKATYRASSLIPFAAAVTINVPFFLIEGSASKTITVTSIRVSGLTLTAVAYLTVAVAKYSTAASGGTAISAPMVPLDSSAAAASAAFVKYYTAVPTAGTLVGAVASWRTLAQAATPAAAATTETHIFEFGNSQEKRGIVLRGASQGLGLFWPVAPATAVTLAADIEWTEE